MKNINARIAALSPEQRALFEKRLKEKNLQIQKATVIPERTAADILYLSLSQERLWLLHQLQPQTPLYNESTLLRLTGVLNIFALEKSINEIIQRHEILRTSFEIVDKQTVQVIVPSLRFALTNIDLLTHPEGTTAAKVEEIVRENSRQPFDLQQAPLLRGTLIQLSEQEHILLLTMHHIISDGWSWQIFYQELATLYQGFCQNTPAVLPKLPIQYADFALWQRQDVHHKSHQLTYWQQQLQDAPPILNLPTDYPRPVQQSFQGGRSTIILPQTLTDALKAFSQQEGVTLFMVLLAAWKTLLYRYTGETDLLVGTPVANRTHSEIENLLGCFVNTLVLRTDVSGELSFKDLVQRVRETALAAYAHQEFPFEQLVKELQPERAASYNPLFQVMFVFQDAPMLALKLPNLTLAPLMIDNGTAKFDLTLYLEDTKQELIGFLEYNTDLFHADTINRMVGHWQTLLAGVVANPQQNLSQLPLLTAGENDQLLQQWNHTQVDYSPTQCIDQLFEAQVEKNPDAVAVVFAEEQLTYQQLNAKANQLAHYLQKLGVKPEVLVGLYVERSLDMIIAILAILKAGGAYLPLDPAYPQERLAFILEDAQVEILLTQESLIANLPSSLTKIVCLDTDENSISAESPQNLICTSTPDHLAYIIYTSGSTGQPKGVLVNHSNVVRLLTATQPWYQFNQKDVFTLFHSIAFDFSVWEIWGGLLNGGRIVVVPYWLSRSPQDFYKLLSSQQVTVLNQTPSAFRQLIQADQCLGNDYQLSLRLVIFGGEALELETLRPWFIRHGDQCPQLVNMYGITETTVHVTYRPLTMADLEFASRSVIGRAIPDLQIYLLDQHLQPVPIGFRGEMYIGGAGVARGYLHRPELTAARFIPHPFSDQPNARLYKSGDLARYLPNGDIEYLGRIDHQVKVRGFRIELGEIENALAKHPDVQDVVVLVRETEARNKQLVAYVVRHNKQTHTSDLRNYLRQRLPDYMVPSAFVVVEALPLTANGKVDHKALPAPDTVRPELEKVFVAPRTTEEKILAQIWAKVLNFEQVGIHDNFFSLGGDSIRSIQVQSLAQEQGLSFSIPQLFQYQTIHELLEAINTTESEIINLEPSQPFSLISPEDQEKLPQGLEDAYPLTMLQRGMIFHSEYRVEATTYHDVFTYHLQAALEIPALQAAIQLLVNRHPILRTSFHLTDFSQPLQLVHENLQLPLQIEDWSHLSTAELENALNTWLEAEKRRNFDWAVPPLLRFFVHRCTEETFYFTVSFHHAILDGWSVATMLTELFSKYFSLLDGKADVVEASPVSLFRDFVAGERAAINSEKSQRYWREKLQDSTITVLPRWDLIPAQAEVKQVREEQVPISEEISQGLQQLAQSRNIPLKSVLLAAHLRVLSLLSGQSDVITGVVTNGRLEHQDGDRTLGLFLNTVPCRLQLSGGTWVDLAQQVFQVEQEWLPHRRYPLAEIQQNLGGLPLFETAFNFTHFHVYQAVLDGKNVQSLGGKFYEETNFPFMVDCNLDPNSLLVKLVLKYDADQFTWEQIQDISGYYARTLAAIVNNPEERYDLHELISAQERHQLLVDWNDTQVDYALEKCLHQWFEAQVQQTPDAVAVVFANQQLTYSQLNAKANQLAHYLQQLGVQPEVLVGICLERSLEMVIGLLGILKAGGAYVPLDPTYPLERLAFMLQDCQSSILLSQQHLVKNLPPHTAQVICLDSDWEKIAVHSSENLTGNVNSENLAYVIYTSGSTGQPKGAMNTHEGICNRLLWMQEQYQLTASDRILQKTPFSFDVSVWEFFWPLITGAGLVMAQPEGHRDSHYLIKLITEEQITTVHFVPSMLQIFLNESQIGDCQHLKRVICSGEALSFELQAKFFARFAHVELHNLYGPTEAAIDVTFWECQRQTPGRVVPIGRPIANTQIYILNQQLQPVPVGVPGELHIGGVGLARGYLHRPQLTTEKFIPHPFSHQRGARLYKTGDLARYLPNGAIEYLGRIDDQVKLRGFRIELGEIAATLEQVAEIQQAVVIVREDTPGDQRLVAYLVPCANSPHPQPQKLRDFLQQQLPQYMIPAAYVFLDTLPLTPNGKLNRRALPAPAIVSETNHQIVLPRNPVEEKLAAIWAEVLGLQQVGIDNNFFELGGHSLLATQVISQTRQAFQVELPISRLFDLPTIALFAEEITQAQTAKLEKPIIAPQRLARDTRRVKLSSLKPNSTKSPS
jgi:amino acid adenylation domain-containing protein